MENVDTELKTVLSNIDRKLYLVHFCTVNAREDKLFSKTLTRYSTIPI